MTAIGAKVFAVSSANKDTIKVFGFGVYDGEDSNNDLGCPNPKITLDSGEVVWGYQCWWGPMTKWDELKGNKQVVEIPIPT